MFACLIDRIAAFFALYCALFWLIACFCIIDLFADELCFFNE